MVLGRDLTPEIVNPALDDIEDYLGVPILRLALAPQNLPHTLAWQLRCLDHRLDDFGLDRASRIGVDSTVLEEKLFQALLALYPKLKLRPGPRVDRWIAAEQVHCCGTLANPALVDFVLDRYESFLVLGKPASIPYLSKEADRRGKKLIFRSDLTCPAEGDYDCVLQTGSWGWSPPQTDKPLFQMMEAGWTPQARNVPSEIVDSCPPLLWANGFGSADERGPSRSVPAQPRPGPAIDPSLPNLACGKSATQSSISPWSRGTTPEQDAANAVNGDPTKDCAFHTAEDLNPWWMVDLGAPARLAFIRIFNREAPPLIQWRAAPLVVEGSLTGEDWDLLFETARDSYFSGYSGRQPLMRQIEHPAPVRLVRISIPRREFLHLSEVEIYGVSSSRAWPSAVNAAG